jgi:hypothetical protein
MADLSCQHQSELKGKPEWERRDLPEFNAPATTTFSLEL